MQNSNKYTSIVRKMNAFYILPTDMPPSPEFSDQTIIIQSFIITIFIDVYCTYIKKGY
jgi:hypothetical protein